jgi:hypothetical protein
MRSMTSAGDVSRNGSRHRASHRTHAKGAGPGVGTGALMAQRGVPATVAA